MHVVGIHLAIACQVAEHAVAGAQGDLLVRHVNTICLLVMLLSLARDIELKELVAERLTYGMPRLVHVGEFLLHLSHLDNLVASEGKGRCNGVVHVTNLVSPAHGNLIAVVLDAAKIDGVWFEGRNACNGCLVGNKDVLTVFPEEV